MLTSKAWNSSPILSVPSPLKEEMFLHSLCVSYLNCKAAYLPKNHIPRLAIKTNNLRKQHISFSFSFKMSLTAWILKAKLQKLFLKSAYFVGSWSHWARPLILFPLHKPMQWTFYCPSVLEIEYPILTVIKIPMYQTH